MTDASLMHQHSTIRELGGCMCRVRDSGISTFRRKTPVVERREWLAEPPEGESDGLAQALLGVVRRVVREQLGGPGLVPASTPRPTREAPASQAGLPRLDKPAFTVDEAAALLGLTRKAVFARAARGQLPGVFRLGRSLRFRGAELVAFLAEGRAPSPGRNRR